MTLVGVVILAFVLPYLIWSLKRFGVVTAGALFVALNALSAVTIIPILDPQRPADQYHGYALGYCLVVLVLLLFLLESGIKRLSRPHTKKYVPGGWFTFFLTLSLVVTAAYYISVGYSALYIGLTNFIAGTSENVTSLRLEGYAGSRYLFPGYVNQFKNALLPALAAVLIHSWWLRGRRQVIPIGLLLLAVAFALLGTGQRGAFILAMAVLLLWTASVRQRAFSKVALLMVTLAIGLLLLSTLALGRGQSEVAQAETTTARVGVLAGQVAERATGAGASGKVAGFRYVYEKKAVTNGHEWYESLVGLSPFSRGSTLPKEIHVYQWGSPLGNSPPSIWASVYHNFGTLGIALAPGLLALFLSRLTLARERGLNSGHPLTLMGVAGVAVAVGFWRAGAPVAMLNQGLVVYAAIWIAGSYLTRKQVARSAASGSGELSLAQGWSNDERSPHVG